MKFKLENLPVNDELEITFFLKLDGNTLRLMARDNQHHSADYFVLNITPDGLSKTGSLPDAWSFVGRDGYIKERPHS